MPAYLQVVLIKIKFTFLFFYISFSFSVIEIKDKIIKACMEKDLLLSKITSGNLNNKILTTILMREVPQFCF